MGGGGACRRLVREVSTPWAGLGREPQKGSVGANLGPRVSYLIQQAFQEFEPVVFEDNSSRNKVRD